jgi:hypothetical protein
VHGGVDDHVATFAEGVQQRLVHDRVHLGALTAMLVRSERAALLAEAPVPDVILGDAQPIAARGALPAGPVRRTTRNMAIDSMRCSVQTGFRMSP